MVGVDRLCSDHLGVENVLQLQRASWCFLKGVTVDIHRINGDWLGPVLTRNLFHDNRMG